MGNVILGMFIVAVAALFLSGAGRFLVAGTEGEGADQRRERTAPPMPRQPDIW